MRDYALLANGLALGCSLTRREDRVDVLSDLGGTRRCSAGALGSGGFTRLGPTGRHVPGRYYEDGTLIWRQRWVTHDGVIESREALARNITDPDSRAMHCTRNGTVQAYNCQVPRCDDGLILAARATQDVNDAAQVEPTLAGITAAQQAIAAGHQAGGHPPAWSRIGTVVYDGGYFSEKNCAAEGPDRLISPGSWESAGSSGPHTPACRHHDPRDQMAHNISTRQGRDIYRRRAPLSEGGFSFLKDKIGLRRFSMRGLPLVQAELTLAATVSNLMLLHRQLPSLPRPAIQPALSTALRVTWPPACPEHDLPPRGPAPQAREHQQPAIPSLARPSKARNPRPAPGAAAHRPRPRESSATRPRAT